MLLGQLLDVAFDARLRGIFGVYVCAQEDVFIEFGFAGAIAADGVDVDASAKCGQAVASAARYSMLNCSAMPSGSEAVTGQTRSEASRSRKPRLL